MGNRLLALSYCVCLLTCCGIASCGGIAEYTRDDLTEGGALHDEVRDPLDPVFPSPEDPPSEPMPDCSDSFTEAEVLFEDAGWISQALSPSANGLEFYYARQATDPSLDDSGTRLPTLRTRPTIDADFGEPVILSELATACESARSGTELAALDISHDGLRLYIGCSAFFHEAGASGPLLVVVRAHLGASFHLPAAVIGEVGISLGLSRDELTAYGTTLDPSINRVLRYKRGSISDSFSSGEIAPGDIAMINPEPSPDGFELWGALTIPGTTRRQIAVSGWNDAAEAYDQPTTIALTPPEGSSDFSPALSGDCRALYFVRYTNSPSALSQVMIARR